MESGALVALPGHAITFSPAQLLDVQSLLGRFAASPHAPPSIKECQEQVGEAVYSALVESGDLVPVSPEVVFYRSDYDAMVADVRRAIQSKGQVTLAEVRDALNTSRRYVQALLEHLDAAGVTVRSGEARKLRQP